MGQLLSGFTDHSAPPSAGRSAGFRSWFATVGTSWLIEDTGGRSRQAGVVLRCPGRSNGPFRHHLVRGWINQVSFCRHLFGIFNRRLMTAPVHASQGCIELNDHDQPFNVFSWQEEVWLAMAGGGCGDVNRPEIEPQPGVPRLLP